MSKLVLKPLISIIVPIYNAELYIHRCIDSILAQTFREFELILINDGSHDNSGRICYEYSQKDTRVRVIHKENEGPGKARNIGIANSNGEFIGFVDSDDYIETTMYQKLYDNANKYHSDIVICGYLREGINSIEVMPPITCDKKLNKGYIKNVLIKKIANSNDLGLYCLWNKLYRKRLILDNNLKIDENINFAEDWFFNITIFSMNIKISGVSECLYHYILNPDGLYSKYREDFYKINLMMRMKLKVLYESNNVSKKDSFIRDIRYFRESKEQINKIFKYSKNPMKLIQEILQDIELRDIAFGILKFNKYQLETNSMSRKYKFFPFMLCYLPINLSYIMLLNIKIRDYLIGT